MAKQVKPQEIKSVEKPKEIEKIIIYKKPLLVNVNQFVRTLSGYSIYITEPFKILNKNVMDTKENWQIKFNEFIGVN